MNINKILRYVILLGIAIIPFIPLYVANSLFFPFITGKAFAFRIIIEIIFAVWLVLVLRERGTPAVQHGYSVLPRFNMMTYAVTVFIAVVFIADLAGLNVGRSLWSNFERMEGFVLLAHLWAYFLVLSSVVVSREEWHKLFNLILAAAGISALYGLSQYFGWATVHQSSSRVDASLGNSAYFGVYMLMNVCLAAYMAFEKRLVRNLLWTYVGLAAVFSFVLFQTGTRGTMLGWIAALLVACGLYALLGRKATGQSSRSRIVIGSVVGLTVFLGILFFFNRDAAWIQANGALGRLATISLSDTKTQARGFIWPMAVKGVFESPKTAFLGIGQENFSFIFNERYDAQMWSHEQWFDRAHSVFLDWLVAGGLLGLAAYLFLYVLALIYLWRSNLVLAHKVILTGLVVGYGVHNVFVFDNQTSYVMFFTFLAFAHSLRQGVVPAWLMGRGQKVSEDTRTIHVYLIIPAIIVAFLVTFYFVNIKPLQANSRLFRALGACAYPQFFSTEYFERALSLGSPMADQEIREQLYQCAGPMLMDGRVSDAEKQKLYNLVGQAVARQVDVIPNDARGYVLASSFYRTIGEWQASAVLLKKAHELSPQKQSIMLPLAVSYLHLKKVDEALVLAREAYRLAPDNPDSQAGYAAALVSHGQEAEARSLFKELISDSFLIDVYAASGDYVRVIAIYRRLMAQNPKDPSIYEGLASAYVANNQPSLAIQVLTQAAQHFPDLKARIDAAIEELSSVRDL